MDLKMTGAQVEQLIQMGFASKKPLLHIEEARWGRVRIRMPFGNWMLRPGNVVSGPALFTAADTAMYALILTHIGPELMAVTANLNLNFLNKAQPGDVLAEAELLKLGRKLAVMDVRLFTSAAPDVLVAQASGSYALPSPKKPASL